MSAEYRVSGRRLRRTPDPEASDDLSIVAVLEQLRAVPAPPELRADFRAELRMQLVAITPRIVAESRVDTAGDAVRAHATAPVAVLDRPRPTPRPRPRPAEDAPPAARRRAEPRESFWSTLRRIPIGRPLGVVASLVTVLALVLGGAVYMSQDSLPGDTLYGLKRASERFELSRTDSDTDRAQKLLEFATTRVDEARQLVSRPTASAAGSGPLAGQLSSQTSTLVSDALASANDDTRTASRLLGGAAVKDASGTPLAGMKAWTAEQLARLSRLRESIPTDAEARARATESAHLVRAVATRAASLRDRVACNCLDSAPSDALGPVPGAATTAPRTTTPAPPKTSRPSGSTGSAPSSSPRTSGTTPSTGGRTGGGSKPAGTSTAPRPVLPSLTVPSVPSKTSKPLVDLCKVTLLGIRLCPTTTP